MKKGFVVAALAVCVMALTSCGTKAPDVSGKWSVETIGDKPVVIFEAMRSPMLVFDCEAGRVYGCTGVNLFNGGFTLDGSAIKFGELATTMMAGPLEAMDQERAFLDALGSAVKVVSSRSGIVLCNEDGREVIHLIPYVSGQETEAPEDEK